MKGRCTAISLQQSCHRAVADDNKQTIRVRKPTGSRLIVPVVFAFYFVRHETLTRPNGLGAYQKNRTANEGELLKISEGSGDEKKRYYEKLCSLHAGAGRRVGPER